MTSLKDICKFSCLFIILAFETALSGCYSLQHIPANEMTDPGNKYTYIHSGYNSYRISDISATDGFLTGTIEEKEVFHSKNKAIHIYFAPDSIVKKGESHIFIPFENIVSVEKFRLEGARVLAGFAGAAGYAITAVLTLYIIAYSSGDDH
ncbi:MAG: hypothetical protein WAL29_03835 [Bacteroidales bacterium]